MPGFTPRRFPPGFLWGAATSAHQVEGGNRWNDWWRFEHGTDVAATRRSGDAARHYERFDQDFALAQADGHNVHRFSIEWSRIEPEPGAIAREGVDHYHAVIASLRARGLLPIATLFHFTLPTWVADAGGWESRATLDRFDAFVRLCAREYGGAVDWWCTVNEPEVYAFRGWSECTWPPCVRDDSRALAVLGNLLEAHGRAYRILHQEDRVDADGDGHPVRAGMAKHVTQLEPLRRWSPLDRFRAWLEDRLFNQAVLRAPITGTIDLSIPGARRVLRHVPELAHSQDWLGINYYTRWQVDAVGRVPHIATKGAPLNDLGWEIWPPGLGLAARRAAGFGLPVLITEHGIADTTDEKRPRFLVESLIALHEAIQAGANVLGYLHWSLMDNFEWAEGYRGRFGLYRVPFETDPTGRERTRSAELFSRIAKANAVPEDVARDTIT